MFPTYEPPEEITTTTGTKTFVFDFTKGDFLTTDGKLRAVDGLEALKVRIEKVLKTEKFRFKVYETETDEEYGATLLEYVNSGHPLQYIKAELEREISEVLMQDPDITSVDSFAFNRQKRTLVSSFTVRTIYGEVLEIGL